MLLRHNSLRLAAVLVAAVVILDLLWALLAGSTGTLAYALIDEPAHLAVCVIGLIGLAALTAARPPVRFVVAALTASVAIDVDHIPGYLGSHALTGTLPRPYTHSLALVGALVAIGWLARRADARQIALGLAFGVSVHLLRDLATGPGVSLFWPLTAGVTSVPYAFFAATIASVPLALMATRRSAPGDPGAAIKASARRGLGPGLLALLVIVGVLAAVVPSATPASSTGAPSRIGLGAYIPHALEDPKLVERYGRSTGRRPLIVSAYQQWKRQPFVPSELNAVWNYGAVPMITWEPWTLSGRGFRLQSIVAGRYDGYLRQSALAAAEWGRPILVRFAHEMNGNWYPWGRGSGGNTPQLYKEAWRHVVELFRQQGADNVLWVWSPNINNSGQFPFRQYYPGDAWVDWVGADGFNWALDGRWASFSKIFANTYSTLSRISSRPIIICETGSSEQGGDKAAWVRRALGREIPRFDRIRAVVWFNERFNGIDPRVDSSRRALDAFRRAAAAPRYALTRSELLGAAGEGLRAQP